MQPSTGRMPATITERLKSPVTIAVGAVVDTMFYSYSVPSVRSR